MLLECVIILCYYDECVMNPFYKIFLSFGILQGWQ
jgi:hypothetical protein